METSLKNIRMRVHDSADLRVDGILRLIEEGGKPGSLSDVLTNMCREVAIIAHADVVSVYVLEEEGGLPVLVMRGNVGFPSYAIGQVRLKVGEGITGFAAECMRPVSAAEAATDSHYKHVPDLGEERFPAFLAIPLTIGKGVAGVLVLQRHTALPFTSTEIQLATAMATIFSHALERTLQRDAASSEPATTALSARLTGKSLSPGIALARAMPLPHLDSLPEPCPTGPVARERIELALSSTTRTLQRAAKRVEEKLEEAARTELMSVMFILEDQRLRDSLLNDCESLGVIAGLRKVAREYAAVPYRAGSDSNEGSEQARSRRAAEIEDLCLLVALTSHNEPLHAQNGSAIISDDRLSSFLVLSLAQQRSNAILVAGKADPDQLPARLARAAGLPVLANVAGLFAWVRPDDTVLVDGPEGLVHVNPSAGIVARHRHERSAP